MYDALQCALPGDGQTKIPRNLGALQMFDGSGSGIVIFNTTAQMQLPSALQYGCSRGVDSVFDALMMPDAGFG